MASRKADIRLEHIEHRGGKPGSDITYPNRNGFEDDCVVADGLSYTYQHQVINVVNLYYREVHGEKLEPEALQHLLPQRILPSVLSRDEVKGIPEASQSLNFCAMLSLILGCGLRRYELLNLKPVHVDSKHYLLCIISANGKKYRMVPLPDMLISLLSDYYTVWKQQVWSFEGQKEGRHYRLNSLQSVLKPAIPKAKMVKSVTLHWLHHSYALTCLKQKPIYAVFKNCLGIKAVKPLISTTMLQARVSGKADILSVIYRCMTFIYENKKQTKLSLYNQIRV